LGGLFFFPTTAARIGHRSIPDLQILRMMLSVSLLAARIFLSGLVAAVSGVER